MATKAAPKTATKTASKAVAAPKAGALAKTTVNVQPLLNQQQNAPAPIQRFGTVAQRLPVAISDDARLESTTLLNQLLADTMTMRDLYKKAHWQVTGPTFYQLHLLFDAHYKKQAKLIDTIAERIQMLGGVTVALSFDVAEMTSIPRAPRDREEVPVMISRILQAHEIILKQCHSIAKKADDSGDDGTNDLAVSDVMRENEQEVWFISEHLADTPLLHAR